MKEKVERERNGQKKQDERERGGRDTDKIEI